MIFVVLTFMISTFQFGCRTLTELFDEEKIRFISKLCIELTFFLSWLMLSLIFSLNFVSSLILTLLWHGFFLILRKFAKKIQESRIRDETEAFLDRVILNLLAGNSFRSSCAYASRIGDAFTQQKIQSVLSSAFHQNGQIEKKEKSISSFHRFITSELSFIDKNSHGALNRIKGLRRNLAIESEFRQKSDQIRGRVWIQSVFMLGLYIAILIFLMRQQEFQDFWSLSTSVTFFVIGFIWTLIDGRKMKWKT